ncbi:MAG: Ig-like domain-containing protein [Clostridia bacterium]|nr:Ig-like domain-containing protein [Clostridia bacterium]
MKNILKYTIIFILFIMLLSLNSVKAHNVELDPKSYISMPYLISNGVGTINVSSSAGANSIYYQHIMLSDAQHKQISDKSEEIKKHNTDAKAKLNEEKAELNTLKTECEKIINSTTATVEEKETVRNNYNSKVEIYNSHVEEAEKKSNELINEYNSLIPSYVEGSWKQATDGKVNIDFSNYNGTIHFVLWAKVTVGSEAYYDIGIYSSTVSSTSISLDKTTATIKKGETVTLKATVSTNDKVTWSSNKTDIATVDANGVVKGISKGVATITATANNKTATCTVTVTEDKTDEDDDKEDENDDDKNNEDKGGFGDFSKATFIAEANRFSYIKIRIDNALVNKECSYKIYLSKSKDESYNWNSEGGIWIVKEENGEVWASITGQDAHNYFETVGTNYLYVVAKDIEQKEEMIIKNYELIGGVQIPQIGQRLDIFLANAQKTMVSNLVNISADRKITYKIGKITSNDILRTFKNDNPARAFQQLLNYAKTAKYLKTGTITSAGENYNLINDVTIEKDAYYFIYMIAEDENGKYIEIEDIAIYQAGFLDGGNVLVHFAFSNINVDDEKTNNNGGTITQTGDKTTATTILPDTGVKYIVIVTIVVVIVVGIISYKRYKKII